MAKDYHYDDEFQQQYFDLAEKAAAVRAVAKEYGLEGIHVPCSRPGEIGTWHQQWIAGTIYCGISKKLKRSVEDTDLLWRMVIGFVLTYWEGQE